MSKNKCAQKKEADDRQPGESTTKLTTRSSPADSADGLARIAQTTLLRRTLKTLRSGRWREVHLSPMHLPCQSQFSKWRIERAFAALAVHSIRAMHLFAQ